MPLIHKGSPGEKGLVWIDIPTDVSAINPKVIVLAAKMQLSKLDSETVRNQLVIYNSIGLITALAGGPSTPKEGRDVATNMFLGLRHWGGVFMEEEPEDENPRTAR